MASYVPDIAVGNQDYISASQQNITSRASNPNNELGQTDFLMLLTTQLQNQDPSEPMDATSFVTDLTQMSQLEAANKTNQTIADMATSFQNMQTMQATSLIGKSVEAEGRDFSHTEGEDSRIRLSADEYLEDITILISNEDGKVQELKLSELGVGEENVIWNGLDGNNNISTGGIYSLTAYGTNVDGDVKPVDTIVGTKVSSVSIGSGGSMTLTLATGERVLMDSVREISG
ncbi:MAG: flagellar basal-body rod modification protein FlgD [Thiomicrorhabdus sp.]|nr:MAG: flagellar basal-body rod modification protein FlgD [Thiomicrorhabdus sp.]